MGSVSRSRLGGIVILLGVMSVGLTEMLPGQQPSSPQAGSQSENENKIINPVTTFDSEVHPVSGFTPLSTPRDKPVSTAEKTSHDPQGSEIVTAQAEKPVTKARFVPEPVPSEEPASSSAEKLAASGVSATSAEPAAGSAASGRAETSPTENTSASEPLKPVAQPDPSAPAPLEVVSFKGVTPGVTTLEEVDQAWGSPKEISKQNELTTQLYSVEPFDRVEVSYLHEKVTSVVVRFNQALPADKVAQQLGLNVVRPVLVSNDLGEILGQVYPERGVLVAFEPSKEKTKPSMKVTHIILEPINAETFILRAETELSSRYEPCLKDLEVALKLEPQNARANWLAARVLAAMEQFPKAELASAEAIRQEPDNPRYHITRAQILGQLGRLDEAEAEAQKGLETSQGYPHVQARALCLLGDLTASGPKPDYPKALAYHTQALQTADRTAENPHPAVRVAAKEVLVDAHLGAAQDIAWGEWKEKEKAIKRWVDRAARFADDLVQHEGGSVDLLFRVYARALAATVGIREEVDPQAWIEEAVRTGEQRIADAADPFRKSQCQWDLGLVLYDAVQIYQSRADHEKAFQYGKTAATYMEAGLERKQAPEASYLLGRLYFRLGAICAVDDQDHAAAAVWFDKAIPLLTDKLREENVTDLGRLGQTLVSMGVSYWELGQRKKAMQLTQRGISLMEQAVGQGTLASAAMVIPYNNLAVMHRRQGAEAAAAKYQQLASKAKESKIK